MTYLKKALLQAHELCENLVHEGDTVIDATMGNGNDTLFLARLVGPTGKVHAFDIQRLALERTREKLTHENVMEQCELIQDGHEHLDQYVKEPVKLVIFNLGYLPKGDHTIGTRAETTIAAVEKSLEILRNDGMIIIIIYYGGDSGFEERDTILDYLSRMDCRKYSVMKTEFINQINCPPIFIGIEKNPK